MLFQLRQQGLQTIRPTRVELLYMASVKVNVVVVAGKIVDRNRNDEIRNLVDLRLRVGQIQFFPESTTLASI